MAGVKGRSGGSRENTGGARPGAGRPPSQPTFLNNPELETAKDAKSFLAGVMNDSNADVKLRIDAAKALLSAELRLAEGMGKKEQQKEAAKQVSKRFAPSQPPKALMQDQTQKLQ